MRLLPLVPSVHESSWVEGDGTEREDLFTSILKRDSHTCRYCGHHAQSWQSVIAIDGHLNNFSEDNLATTCVLCESVQRLGNPKVDDELAVIWLPEISQAALNCVVRRIHVTLHAHGEPAHPQVVPRSRSAKVTEAIKAYRALEAEIEQAKRRIDTGSPGELGAALLKFRGRSQAEIARMLGGIRLLHKGQMIRRGRDIYPEILTAWSTSVNTTH